MSERLTNNRLNMANPLVSIGIPTRNRAALLKESLRTICAQTHSPLEILISDDASNDGTEELSRQVAAADPRVRYVRHATPLGCYANHNFCIDETRGDFLCLFHDDDQHHPDLVKEYAAFLVKHPEVGLVCSDWDLLDEAGHLVGTREHHVPEVMSGLDFISLTIRSGQSSIGIPGAMIRRSALGSVRLRQDGPLAFADFVVWFRIAEQASIGHIARRLWQYRLVQQSVGHRRIETEMDDYDDQLSRFCDGHLLRYPQHADLVARWRKAMRRYIFWARVYELGLHLRKDKAMESKGCHRKTVYEIRDCGLSTEEFQRAVQKLRNYRVGFTQHAVYAIIKILLRLDLTRPLAWATYRHPLLRSLLGLR